MGPDSLPLFPSRFRHREEQLVIVTTREGKSPRLIKTLHGKQLIRERQAFDRECRTDTARGGQLGEIRQKTIGHVHRRGSDIEQKLT